VSKNTELKKATPAQTLAWLLAQKPGSFLFPDNEAERLRKTLALRMSIFRPLISATLISRFKIAA
jgi:hypothetical protein